MTSFEAAKAWRARYKAMREKFEASQTEALNALTTAMNDQTTGSGDLVARVAAARIKSEAQAKAAALAKQPVSTAINTNSADIKESMFSESKSARFDTGTSVDLNKGTITLSNGKTIDIATGAKVYDFTA
ncbi:MAG: hypothetical protein AB7K04_15015 [Pseudorhodoplanes sp.]